MWGWVSVQVVGGGVGTHLPGVIIMSHHECWVGTSDTSFSSHMPRSPLDVTGRHPDGGGGGGDCSKDPRLRLPGL